MRVFRSRKCFQTNITGMTSVGLYVSACLRLIRVSCEFVDRQWPEKHTIHETT